MLDDLLHLVNLADLTNSYSATLKALTESDSLDDVQQAKLSVAVAHLSEASKVIVAIAREVQAERGAQ